MPQSMVTRVRRGKLGRAGLAAALTVIAGSSLACGGGESDPETQRPGTTATTQGSGLALQVSWSPERPKRDEEMTWRLEVKNSGSEALELVFSSGQNGDVVVRQEGREVHRWSAERVFSQEVRNEPLGAGESRTYELADRVALEPGDYEVEATLSAEPAPTPATARLEMGG
ncbi:MAG: BsuPI-related putative proteinase inhibitor [Acidimicrobiia bacterium]